MTLNLEAKTTAEQRVKAYLEQNASEVLARKINEGVKIVKDGKTLLNKKTLSGFLKFACDEAKKQAEKGAQSACIDDAVVYGWAVHYFEEDGIEGTLYNEDGTEYKPAVTKPKSVPTYTPPKPKPKPQISIFDMMAADEQKQPADEPDDEPTDEDYAEAEEAVQAPPPPPAQPQDSPAWQRYVDPETGRYMLGDIVICVERALEQACEYGHSATREMCYLFVHGLCHLFGFDHETDEQRAEMRRREEAALSACGVTREV